MKNKIVAGSKIKLFYEKSELVSVIQYIGKDYILAEVPIVKGSIKDLFNIECGIEIYNINGFLIKGKTEIHEITNYDSIRVIKIAYPRETEEIQRRKYYRISGNEVIYVKTSSKTKDKCIMENLSGAGMKINTPKIYEVGDDIYIEMKINNKFINVSGSIVRREKIGFSNYAYGIQFKDIDDDVREIIINKVFSKLQKELKDTISN